MPPDLQLAMHNQCEIILKLETGKEVLVVNFPLLSANDGHEPTSLADLHSHKPLPEISTRVDRIFGLQQSP